jgi:hypothetical protein
MKSKEEILAKKLDDLLADSRIEPYLIGRYFAQSATVDVYDNFEEMVESARDEKQNRIEWIKDIIIGEKSMETTTDNKIFLLAQFDNEYRGESHFDEFFETEDVGLPLAFLYTTNMVTGITELGLAHLDSAFGALLEVLEINEDTGFTTLEELVEASPLW